MNVPNKDKFLCLLKTFCTVEVHKKVPINVNDIALPKIHHGLEKSILFASNLSTFFKKTATVKFSHKTDTKIRLHCFSPNPHTKFSRLISINFLKKNS